jgi:hypothetical protein
MSATDKRVEDLLDRWLASVELHLRYLKLDDAAYARAEAWPKHQRPNALVVNLARTRLLELKSHLSERRDAGDAKFAESLELMSFLTSLLGSEHIERFVPLATGKPRDAGTSGTVEQPRIRTGARAAAEQKARSGHDAQVASKPVPSGAAAKSSTGSHKRPTRPAGSSPAGATGTAGAAPRTGKDTVSQQLVGARPRAAPAMAPPAEPAARSQPSPASPPPPRDAMTQQVIADAIRMLEWGREWPALAGLIGRMADRPPEAEIWKILRTYRNDILAKSRRTG